MWPDGRGRPPYLRSWRGWRHLRFMLPFSPRWLFLYPGFASLAVVVGFQSMLFWVFTKIYGAREGIVPPDPWFHSVVGVFTLEVGLITGAVLLLIGLALGLYAVEWSVAAGLGPISPTEVMRLVIPSGTAILLAFQIASSAFFISVLEIRASRVSETKLSERSARAA